MASQKPTYAGNHVNVSQSVMVLTCSLLLMAIACARREVSFDSFPLLSSQVSHLPDKTLDDAEEDGGEESPGSEVVRDEVGSSLPSHGAEKPQVSLSVPNE